MSEQAKQPRIDPAIYRLRDALTNSQTAALMGNILGAFPDDPETWERLAERHGRQIKRHLDAVSNLLITDLAQAGQLPVRRTLNPEFTGYVSGRAGR